MEALEGLNKAVTELNLLQSEVDGEDQESLTSVIVCLEDLKEQVQKRAHEVTLKSLDAIVNDPKLTPGSKLRRYVEYMSLRNRDDSELVTSKVRG